MSKESALRSFHQDVVGGELALVKAKAKPKAKAEESKQLEPKSFLEQTMDFAKAVLQDAKEARGISLALKGQELSQTLVTQMSEHSRNLEQVYEELQKLMAHKPFNKKSIVDRIQELQGAFEQKRDWFMVRTAVARAMQQQVRLAAKPKSAPKAKGKAKAKAAA